MAVSMWLDDSDLKRYQAWKQDLRSSIRLVRKNIQLLIQDGSLRRLRDSDFYPIFICGAAGSGTTLLGGLLDQNYESELCIHVSDRNAQTSRLMWMEKSLTYDTLDEYVEDLLAPNKQSISRVRNAVLGLYRRLVEYPRRSNVVLDKAPNSHLLRIGKLREAFPQSGAILLYRDPVEVIEGLKRKWPRPFGAATIEELCEFWNYLHESFLEATQDFGSDRLVLSYKSLVAAPEERTGQIAKHFHLEPRNSQIDYKEKANKPGKGIRNVVDGKIQVVPRAFDQVDKVLGEDEFEIIRELTGSTYGELKQVDAEQHQRRERERVAVAG